MISEQLAEQIAERHYFGHPSALEIGISPFEQNARAGSVVHRTIAQWKALSELAHRRFSRAVAKKLDVLEWDEATNRAWMELADHPGDAKRTEVLFRATSLPPDLLPKGVDAPFQRRTIKRVAQEHAETIRRDLRALLEKAAARTIGAKSPGVRARKMEEAVREHLDAREMVLRGIDERHDAFYAPRKTRAPHIDIEAVRAATERNMKQEHGDQLGDVGVWRMTFIENAVEALLNHYGYSSDLEAFANEWKKHDYKMSAVAGLRDKHGRRLAPDPYVNPLEAILVQTADVKADKPSFNRWLQLVREKNKQMTPVIAKMHRNREETLDHENELLILYLAAIAAYPKPTPLKP